MAGAVDAVDLASTEETPPPRKRLRAEQGPKEVLSLVDSDDDIGSPAAAAPDAGAARASENYAGRRLWGALGGHAGAAGGEAAAAADPEAVAAGGAGSAALPVDGQGDLGRPLYRPPSARFRRPGAVGVAAGGQRGGMPTVLGPAVIDVADDDDDNDQQSPAAEASPQAAFTGRPGMAARRDPLRQRYGMLDSDAAADEADSGPTAGVDRASPMPQQQPNPHSRLRQRLVLPRPRGTGGALAAGAAGGSGAGGSSLGLSAGAAWGMRFQTLDLGPDDFDAGRQRSRRTARAAGGSRAAAAGAGDVGAAQEDGNDNPVMPLHARIAMRQAAARAAERHAGTSGESGSSDPMAAWGRLSQRRLQLPEAYLGDGRSTRTGGAVEQVGAAGAGGSGAAGSGSAAAAGPAANQEEEDMRLAARLQAEEDERLARETARRLEQEEHRRMMALAAPVRGTVAQHMGSHSAGGHADSFSPGMAAVARAEAAMLRSQLPWQTAHTSNQQAGSAAPYQYVPYGAPAVPAAAAAAPAPPLFAAPAAGPGARSRLDMYEALEEHSQAAARRGRAQAAIAALEERERERAAAAAASAAAAAAAAAGAGNGEGRSNAERQRREQELYGRAARARGARGSSGGSGIGGAAGDVGGAAGAGAGPMGLGLPAGFPGLFMLGGGGGRGGGVGGRGAGGGPAGAPRWSARALHDLLPMMAGLHRGFMAMGPPDDDSDGDDDGPGFNPLQAPHPGNPGAHRRGRHAAYREQARAMREQMLAAQRAGIPAHLLLNDRDFTPEDYEMLCRLDERVENRKGAKDDQLAMLPTEVLTADNPRRRSDGAPATCAICMEDLAPGETVKRMPCAHEFHDKCLDQWLRTKACCPICQRGLLED